MKRRLIFSLALALSCPTIYAQSMPPPGEMARANPPPPPTDDATPPPAATPAPAAAAAPKTTHEHEESQAAIDRLTATNAKLIDLLNQQQEVLKDIQYDRRLQNRQIMLLEQRLEDTLQLNAALQAKVSTLEAQAAAAAANPPTTTTNSIPAKPEAAAPVTPPAPTSYLPPEQPDGAPGTLWWHRVTSLAGDDSKNTDVFHVTGKQWRVIWHNQDKPGDMYKNTSALFINAFPAHDIVPKKICSQLGSGGDTKIVNGSGDYYLKIESSGGHWEFAVEDFR